jgi:thiol-disulfide isomerase/thioredoxin
LSQSATEESNANYGTSGDEEGSNNLYERPEEMHNSRASTLVEREIPKSDVQMPRKVDLKIGARTAAFDFKFLESLMNNQGYSMFKKKINGVILKCPEDHNVNIKYREKLKVLECKKCKKRLIKCIQFAQLNNGKVKNKEFSSVIRFECEREHEWECKYGKRTLNHWCPYCEKIKQEEARRAIEEETENERQQAIREQNAKLEEARHLMNKEQVTNYQALFYQWDMGLKNEGLTDASVNKLSKELVDKYLRDNACNLLISFEDIFLVYKILITAQEILVKKLRVVPVQDLSSFYRKCAMRLHPDKNKHPKASEAFQKLTECYRQCLTSLQ